jgi:hypothetical protein
MPRLPLAPLLPFLFALPACALSTPRALGWDAVPPAKQAFARVALSAVRNHRPTDRGGANANLVGYWRTPFGQRSPFRIEDDAEPILLSVRNLVRDALRTAGIDVATTDLASATALVNVDLRELWTDDDVRPEGRITLDLIVLDPATRAERTRMTVEGQGEIGSREAGATPECHGSTLTTPHCAYFVVAMNEVYRSIVEELARPEVRSALQAVQGAAAPP